MPASRCTFPRQPADQADGLRRRFARGDRHVLALVHNPFVAFAGVAMERLAAALGAHGLHTLVVDAADTASAPHELAGVDLGACIEALSADTSYLAARGLPGRWADAHGSTAGFLQALRHAAPQAGAVLLHAGASDLRRAFAGRAFCPLVLAGSHAESVTHAYAAIKLLSQRAGVGACDLVVVGGVGSAGARLAAERGARRLAGCAKRFLDVNVRAWCGVDPAGDARDATDPELDALVALQLEPDARAFPIHAFSHDAARAAAGPT